MIRRSPSPIRKNFTVLPNATLTDKRLSWEARGMLAYLLSKPDHWKVIPKALINDGTAGRNTVYRILKELEQLGYITQEQPHKSDGTFSEVERVVHEVCISEDVVTASPITAYGSTAYGDAAYIVNTDVEKELNSTKLVAEATADTPPPKPYSDDFEAVWAIYPRRVSKREAYGCYKARLADGATPEQLLSATEAYARIRRGEEPKFTLHPKTFFGKNDRWRDYLPDGSEIQVAETQAKPRGFSAIQEFLNRGGN